MRQRERKVWSPLGLVQSREDWIILADSASLPFPPYFPTGCHPHDLWTASQKLRSVTHANKELLTREAPHPVMCWLAAPQPVQGWMAHSGSEHEIMNAWPTALHSSQSVKAVDGDYGGLWCQSFNLLGALLSDDVPGFLADFIPVAISLTRILKLLLTKKSNKSQIISRPLQLKMII